MRTLAQLLAVLVLLPLTGCVVQTFDHAASNSENSVKAEELCGEWVPVQVREDGTIERQEETLLIGYEPDNGPWMLAAFVHLDENNELTNESRRFLATRIGDHNFLSVGLTDEHEGKFILAKYTYDQQTERLKLRWVNATQLKEAVQQGLLSGTLVEESQVVNGQQRQRLRAIHVDASTEQLREFLEQHPDRLFNEEAGGYLERK